MRSRNLNLACGFYSRDVYMSNSWPFLQDQRASLHQGPHVESRIRSGATGRSASQNVSILLPKEIFIPEALLHTFVPLQPNRYAASFATSSPKPNMSPLTNGRNRLMAAPRSNPQIVGGL